MALSPRSDLGALMQVEVKESDPDNNLISGEIRLAHFSVKVYWRWTGQYI
jgi:hypothetical protein